MCHHYDSSFCSPFLSPRCLDVPPIKFLRQYLLYSFPCAFSYISTKSIISWLSKYSHTSLHFFPIPATFQKQIFIPLFPSPLKSFSPQFLFSPIFSSNLPSISFHSYHFWSMHSFLYLTITLFPSSLLCFAIALTLLCISLSVQVKLSSINMPSLRFFLYHYFLLVSPILL